MKIDDYIFNQQGVAYYDDCPQKFAKCCLNGLRINAMNSGEQEEAIKRGVRFHLEAERFFNDLPLSSAEDNKLANWLVNLKNNFGYLKGKPEYQLYYQIAGRQLTAKYDFLVYQDGKAVIYDWKTNHKPLKKMVVEKSWQTCLYRYLLVKVSPLILGCQLEPEDVSMVYWNPSYPAQKIKLPYDARQMASDEGKIKDILEKVASDTEFTPKPSLKCRFCDYQLFCNNKQEKIQEDDILDDWLMEEPIIDFEDLEEMSVSPWQ